MKRLRFSQSISAHRERVWQILFEDETFRDWASLFAEGSYYLGDWDEGSTIRFLTPEMDGMIGQIAEKRIHEFMSIKHVGIIDKGNDDLDSDEVKTWFPSFENYTLNEVGDGTELIRCGCVSQVRRLL